MPLNIEDHNYWYYQIIQKQLIYQKFAQNLKQLLNAMKVPKNQINTDLSSTFDFAHLVLENNQQYLKYCASVLSPDRQAVFMDTITIVIRNQELNLISLILNWSEYSKPTKKWLTNYSNWDQIIEQLKPAEQSPKIYLGRYFKLAQTCQNALQKAFKNQGRA